MLRVGVRSERIIIAIRKIPEGGGEFMIERIPMPQFSRGCEGDLLFEERMKHHGRTPRILESSYRVQLIPEGRRACHERLGVSKSQVGGIGPHTPPPKRTRGLSRQPQP